jgi:simple sugar transport system permease protein
MSPDARAGAPGAAAPSAAPGGDAVPRSPVTAQQRIRHLGPVARFMRRPDFGALVGVVIAWLLFAGTAGGSFMSLDGTASYLAGGAELGIIAAAVALLMIAGEFDLSVGSMVGAAGMLMTLLVAEYGWPLWAAILMSLVFGAAYGALNGYIIIRTKLPSFIVTLAGLFILRGLTIAVTRLITGRTQVGLGLEGSDNLLLKMFTGHLGPFPVSVVWWLVAVGLCSWILVRTRFGNWITAVGGNEEGARNSGVPVARVKITMFAATAFAAALLGIIQCLVAGSADTLRGEQKEFEAIIAAVIGGSLLTGGYGSVIGAALGALTFAMVRQGIFFTGVDTDWFRVILGSLLLLAVFANNYLRMRALRAR